MPIYIILRSLKILIFFEVKLLSNINRAYIKVMIYAYFLYSMILIVDIDIVYNNDFPGVLALKVLNKYEHMHYLQILLSIKSKILSITLQV